VGWGLVNLTHRNSDGRPEPLVAGTTYEVGLRLNAIGHRFSAGNRLRLAISPTYWPHAWPSPHPVRLVLSTGGHNALMLPAWDPAEPPRPATVVRDPEFAPRADDSAHRARTRVQRQSSDTLAHVIDDQEEGRALLPPLATEFVTRYEDTYTIGEHDPLSAATTSVRDWSLERDGWAVRVRARATMRSDAQMFHVDDTLEAWEGTRAVFLESRRISIPRRGV